MIRSASLLLLAGIAAHGVAADSPNLLRDGWKIDHDVRLDVGLAPPVVQADVRGSPQGDQRAWTGWAPGAHLGVRFDRQALYIGHWGWLCGLELAGDLHRGDLQDVSAFGGNRVTAQGTAQMQAAQARFHVGPIVRFEGDRSLIRALPTAYQLELTGHAGAGYARGRLAAGSWTRWSMLTAWGGDLTLTSHLGDGWTLGVVAGYEDATADLRYADTTWGTWRARGINGRLQLGRRF